jgi:cation diffusion facilitator family transporter
MHTHDLTPWIHDHRFDKGSAAAERSTKAVMWITATMMVVEIWAGWVFNSMALLADGWHMSSHALAIGLSALAYVAARRYAGDTSFAFGTWKIEVLGGFASALLLVGIAGLMVFGSVARLFNPQQIQFQQAIAVAVVGLVVNVVCAVILERGGHDHDAENHGHHHGAGGHGQYHQDLNLRSAYVHVVADAATSVLAIVALTGGMLWGWMWLDPVMGIVGAGLVAVWAWGLMQSTGRVLLDKEMDHPVSDEIRTEIAAYEEGHDTRIADLHVWRVGKSRFACIVSLVTHDAALNPQLVKHWLSKHEELAHVTVEIQHCPGDAHA